MARTYRRASRTAAPELPWVLSLNSEQRLLFRERGHALAGKLLQFLDALLPEAAEEYLGEAADSASEYGRIAAGMGLSLSQTIEGFLRFRAPFHQQLAIAARRRGFDAKESTDLLTTAERAMDRLLLATLAGHSGGAPR